MSTQAGIWNFDGEPVDQELLSRISESIAEYGPDDEKTHLEGGLGILYRPFHTTLESRRESQPHVSVTGTILTWDGRLDNRDELLAQLDRNLADDRTDVAIVAAAFERWGRDCFAMLIGDWALAIWNTQDKELILARDYIGVRHLFYYPTPKRVIWCTQLAPLVLSTGDRFTLCDEYIAGFLTTYPNADLTPYREVLSVAPGHFVQMKNRKSAAHAYWTFRSCARSHYNTDSEYEERFLHLFRQSVRRRLRTDSPVLADLSGGLDSSSIVCMADDILAKEGADTAVHTFSICDRKEPDDDDFSYFVKVEEKRGRPGNHVELSGTGDSIAFLYPRFTAAPLFRGREEVKSAQSKLIKDGGFRVTFSGQGGDELLGQAMDPKVQMADLLVQLRLREFTRQLMAWSLLIRRPWMQLLSQTILLLMPVSLRAHMTSAAEIDDWIDTRFARKHQMAARLLQVVDTPWYWLPRDRDSVQTQVSIAQQMTQRSPSTHEARYPYLDQNLTEFLLTIPRDQLLRPGDRRSLMRRALKDLLPEEIRTRRTKSGAGRCFVIALEKHRGVLEQILAAPISWQLGYVDKHKFHTTLKAIWTGHTLSSQRFLEGLSLETWLRNAVSSGVLSAQQFSTDRMVLPPEFVASQETLSLLATSASSVVNTQRERR